MVGVGEAGYFRGGSLRTDFCGDRVFRTKGLNGVTERQLQLAARAEREPGTS